jgi:hypothetical protein
MSKHLILLTLTLLSCTVTSSGGLACLEDADYERALQLIHTRTTVTSDELRAAFGPRAKFSPDSISIRVHDDERGCVCCITFDLESAPRTSTYSIKSIYIFYSATDREDVLKHVDKLVELWAPDNFRAQQTTFPSSAGKRKERRTYIVGDRISEASIDTYPHHGIWTASLNLFVYDVAHSK